MINDPVYKKSYEQFAYTIDFVDKLPASVSLASGTGTAKDITDDSTYDALLLSTTATVSATNCTLGITGGTAGHDYVVTYKAQASDGVPTKVQEEILVRVRD